jgi:hypothetical protein
LSEKAELNIFGIVRCDKRGEYVGPVTAQEEKSLGIYAEIFRNEGEMVKISGPDGKPRYYRLKGKKPKR